MTNRDATDRATPPTPQQLAEQAYQSSIAALYLVDGLNLRESGYVPDDAQSAARTALKASLAALLLIACPGAEAQYYADAAEEIYLEMFTEGRSIAESLRIFLADGFRHVQRYRTGHAPYTFGTSDSQFRGGCDCGWTGTANPALSSAESEAIVHASWPIILPIMPLPREDPSSKKSWKDILGMG